jgi:hypothetical protein
MPISTEFDVTPKYKYFKDLTAGISLLYLLMISSDQGVVPKNTPPIFIFSDAFLINWRH